MNLLVRNEFMKLKRLKSIYFVFVLSFFPYIVNTVGLFLKKTPYDATKYYMFVFNQYAFLLPAIVFIFSGFYFYIEYKNKTMLNWMSYPFKNFQLIFSKIVATFIVLFSISIVNHVFHLATLWIVFQNEQSFSDVLSMFLTSVLFTVLSLCVIPIAALLASITKNIMVVSIAGVLSFFVMTILLAGNVSILFPFSFIYRISMQTFDYEMGYSDFALQAGGSAIFAAYILAALIGLYVYSKKTRSY
ncbi:ABC transporter permease [Priestia endophytica]|uniref:ABC-2 type transport system permease protein n=1 Tax=Priestia endophytica DSM 13796 TaxID=1121089 RepID=A0A1I6AXQ3_9BACI|nr:ABC transporter permease [Priestia endophytica]KYG31260.1 hypothetical protein AZF06_05815 [Priestia endophytica]SFQ73491.1 ABC-2 type transport system permease protein [Priestia endophytica DSM 13796]